MNRIDQAITADLAREIENNAALVVRIRGLIKERDRLVGIVRLAHAAVDAGLTQKDVKRVKACKHILAAGL